MEVMKKKIRWDNFFAQFESQRLEDSWHRVSIFGAKKRVSMFHEPGVDWLVVSTHLKNISQLGSSPQVGVKIKNIWNHHQVDFGVCFYCGSIHVLLRGVNHPQMSSQWLNDPRDMEDEKSASCTLVRACCWLLESSHHQKMRGRNFVTWYASGTEKL